MHTNLQVMTMRVFSLVPKVTWDLVSSPSLYCAKDHLEWK